MMTLRQRFGIDVPIIQAPMAGVQGSALAIAVSNAGALGSLPCAMLSPEGLAQELAAIGGQTARAFNVNFFCHVTPPLDANREAAWRAALTPYYREFDIDASSIKPGPGRAPFRVGEHRQRSGISVRTAPGASAPVRDMARCVAVLEPVDRQCPPRPPCPVTYPWQRMQSAPGSAESLGEAKPRSAAKRPMPKARPVRIGRNHGARASLSSPCNLHS